MQRAKSARVIRKATVVSCVMCGIGRFNESGQETGWCYKCSTPMVTIV